jgi:hypothetical protein
MQNIGTCLRFLVAFSLLGILNCSWPGEGASPAVSDPSPYTTARAVGRLGDARLVECSGMDASRSNPGMLWAVNDGGDGPFLYALAEDGRSLGRVCVRGARNRDWEGLDTFRWQGRAMILIADVGDNRARHEMHTLYVVPEPPLTGDAFGASAAVDVAWRIVFMYPDGPRDAEGVAVDAEAGEVLVLTKRDQPPLLFAVPLLPSPDKSPVTARRVAPVEGIPPPSAVDLTRKYGLFVSQPTALDLSADGRRLLVLTYKHAYLFPRESGASWTAALRGAPHQIPLPTDHKDLSQREAICFGHDDRAIFVTSEGRGAGIFRSDVR